MKQLLETLHKNDDDISELFFLRKFAMQHPAAAGRRSAANFMGARVRKGCRRELRVV